MRTAESLLEPAKRNREEFLKPYKERFERAKSRKERAEIISEAVSFEPSHLEEPWIIREIVEWMRRRDCVDFLETVFVKTYKKTAPTDGQRRRTARNLLVKEAVSRFEAQGLSERAAVGKLIDSLSERGLAEYLGYDLENPEHEIVEALRNNCKEAKKEAAYTRVLPYPYYGLDIVESENVTLTLSWGLPHSLK